MLLEKGHLHSGRMTTTTHSCKLLFLLVELLYCFFVLLSQFKSVVTQQEFNIKPLITCDSDHVTYVLECLCSLQYVGRTTRQLKVRINEHLTNIKNGYPNHSVSRHFKLCHDSDPSLCTFYGIDKISRDWRGTHMKRAVSKNETYWLYKLQTMQPHGMNIDLDLNCFLTND